MITSENTWQFEEFKVIQCGPTFLSYLGHQGGIRLDLRIAHRAHSPTQPNPPNGLGFGPMPRAHRWVIGPKHGPIEIIGAHDGGPL
ncbi:hypothetical protein ACN38_g12832 [Penicillium nordicum]|uniref:Uncharacterized protein n=1 Tax=Penicillium nordicum TaxID=229535 RepID=A0A0M8NQ39_9EURO|nr:hypothetical protein ACN38_g12832 [Penicillium nordicum]